MSERPARSRRRLFLIGAVVAFAVAEGTARLLTRAPLDYLEHPRRLLAFDEERCFVLRAGASDYTIDRPVTVNADGFRDRTFSKRKGPGTRRIVCVGDSYTFGRGVDAEHSYPKQLERRLDRRDRPVEALNLGVFGYDVTQALTTLRKTGVAFEPDVVVYGFYWDDMVATKRTRFDPAAFEARMVSALVDVEESPLRALLKSIRSLYALVDFTRTVRGAISPPSSPLSRVQQALLDGRDDEVSEHWRAEERAFASMAEVTRSVGAKLVLATWPIEPQVGTSTPRSSFQTRARELAAAHGATHVDLLPALKAVHARGGHPYLAYDSHPSAESYDEAAAAIASAIERERLLDR